MKLNNFERLRRVYKYKDFPTLCSVAGKRTAILLVQSMPYSLVYGWFECRKKLLSNVSDANPCDPVYVDPREIKWFDPVDRGGLGIVLDGDWDRTDFDPIDQHVIYKSIHNHFQDDVSWEQTKLYEVYYQQIQSGDPNWKCPTVPLLEDYLGKIDDLYKSIKEDGYLSQRQLLEQAKGETRKSNNDALHPALNEVTVNISRDGQFAKSSSGDHRLAIARTLELDRIPVIVEVRHSQWETIRNKIMTSDSTEELNSEYHQYLDHPDLRNVRPAD